MFFYIDVLYKRGIDIKIKLLKNQILQMKMKFKLITLYLLFFLK
jgi:hypothetical protein